MHCRESESISGGWENGVARIVIFDIPVNWSGRGGDGRTRCGSCSHLNTYHPTPPPTTCRFHGRRIEYSRVRTPPPSPYPSFRLPAPCPFIFLVRRSCRWVNFSCLEWAKNVCSFCHDERICTCVVSIRRERERERERDGRTDGRREGGREGRWVSE